MGTEVREGQFTEMRSKKRLEALVGLGRERGRDREREQGLRPAVWHREWGRIPGPGHHVPGAGRGQET